MRNICSKGSRSGTLSRISWCSRIKIISPSLLKSHCASPALSSLWGAILFSVFRPQPVSKRGWVLLDSSMFLPERGGPPPSPASVAFQSYQNLASPDFSGSLTRDACSSSPTWQAFLSSWWKGIHSCGEMPLLGVGLEDHKPVAYFSRNCILVPPPSCAGILSSHPSSVYSLTCGSLSGFKSRAACFNPWLLPTTFGNLGQAA